MFNNQILAGSSGQGGSFYSYSIGQALRVDDAASQRMYHNTVVGDYQKFTMSCWIKRTELGTGANNSTIMSSWNGASNFVNMYFSNDYLYCYICDNRSGFVDYNFGTANSLQKFRDIGAWMHIVMAVDTTQASIDNRAKIWINGVSVDASSNGSGNDIPQNYNMEINDTPGQTFLFHNPDSTNYYASFYIAELVYVDGTQYNADKFGEFNNGVWTPLNISAQSINFGNNGFYLDFADSSDLGKDVSGEGHHFTSGTRSAVVNNIGSDDQVFDTPTNNFAVMNYLDNLNWLSQGLTRETYSQGNLQASGTSWMTRCTFRLDSGKWYWEARKPANYLSMGIYETDGASNNSNHAYYYYQGNVYDATSNRSSPTAVFTGSNHAAGTIIGVEFDADNLTLEFYANGSSIYKFTSLDAGKYTASFGTAANTTFQVNFGQDPAFCGQFSGGDVGTQTDENGNGLFKYAPSSGFLAICTANLPEPDIGPNSATQADEHFDTALWTADVSNPAAGDKQISLNFQPDWVWSKNRNNAEHHYWMDSVRGDNDGSKWLKSNSTAAEGADAVGSTTAKYNFTSTGFDIIDTNSGSGEVYYNSRTYVGWCWKAGTTFSGTTNGGKAYSGSSNADAGFSIITYVGNETAGHQIPHNLNSAPEMVITKARGFADQWPVYHKGVASDAETDFLRLNTTAAAADAATVWNDTAPSATVVTLGSTDDHNKNNIDQIMYCFHSVPGYSSVGSYKGNGNADGMFVPLDFRPAWVMVRRSSSTAGWHIFDNKRPNAFNVINKRLEADNTDAENSTSGCEIDFLSNGFKFRGTFDNINGSGATHIYLAFAEAPLKYANAR